MAAVAPRLAVFGSAFDPPHLGHADVVRQLRLRFSRVILVPAAAHAFGKLMAPFESRLSWLETLVGEQFGADPGVQISALEAELLAAQSAPGPVYSIDVLEALAEREPGWRLVLVIGPDNARPETWRRFHRHRDIEDRFGLHVVTERLPVHSSEVRALLRVQPLDRARLVACVGPALAGRLAEADPAPARGS